MIIAKANAKENLGEFICQGQILAVWILASKLLNSDLEIAVDFWVDFFLLFFPRKRARKNPPKNPRQNSPGKSVGKIPLRFLQKPSLDLFVFPLQNQLLQKSPDFHL